MEVAKSVLTTLMGLWCVCDFVVGEYEGGRGRRGIGWEGWGEGGERGEGFWRRRWGTLRGEGGGVVVLL